MVRFSNQFFNCFSNVSEVNQAKQHTPLTSPDPPEQNKAASVSSLQWRHKVKIDENSKSLFMKTTHSYLNFPCLKEKC